MVGSYSELLADHAWGMYLSMKPQPDIHAHLRNPSTLSEERAEPSFWGRGDEYELMRSFLKKKLYEKLASVTSRRRQQLCQLLELCF